MNKPSPSLVPAAPGIAAPEPILRLAGVTKRFGTLTAVDGVDLDVRDGEFLTVVGPSGCGKTTLLRMLAGLEQPTEGEIALRGRVSTTCRRTGGRPAWCSSRSRSSRTAPSPRTSPSR